MTGTRLDLLDNLPKNAVCAELGTFKGDFAQEILTRCRPKRLFLVDMFHGLVTSGDQNGENLCQIDMAEEYYNVRKRFEKEASVIVVPSDSVQWLSLCGIGFLDWVYIDTVHSADHTWNELEAAFDSVRPDGQICGHDYSPQFPGVVNSVNEFCVRHSLRLELWTGDKLPSYQIKI